MDNLGSAVKSLSENINIQISDLKDKLKAYILSLPDMNEVNYG